MIKYLIIIIIFVIFFYLWTNKIHIKLKTFLQKGYLKKDSPFGVYCYVGKQGKGKTQNVYAFLLENKDKRIYANMKSIKNIHYKYFNGLDELLKLRNETDCIIFYDEIFKIMTKGTKFNEDIMDFLSQMRKRRIIFITTAQEWLEIPITLRRYCRYMVNCNIKTIGSYPIIIKTFGDAENMKWDNLENEYVCPTVETVIEHGRDKIVSGYDTNEQISSENISPVDTFNPLFKKSNDELFLEGSTSKNDEEFDLHTPISHTTTSSNRCVSVSVDEQTLKSVKETDPKLTSDLPLFDNDFWEDFDSNDFTN